MIYLHNAVLFAGKPLASRWSLRCLSCDSIALFGDYFESHFGISPLGRLLAASCQCEFRLAARRFQIVHTATLAALNPVFEIIFSFEMIKQFFFKPPAFSDDRQSARKIELLYNLDCLPSLRRSLRLSFGRTVFWYRLFGPFDSVL